MGKPRSELSSVLHEICPNVYFQPPNTLKLSYPCIIYKLEKIHTWFADNGVYGYYDMYSMTYITRDPDDSAIHSLIMLPLCSFNRAYSSENLHHYAYEIYN